MVRVFANSLGDLGLIPGQVIPKTKKWYLMPPCLTLIIIRYGSKIKWVNPGIGVAPSPTPWFSSYWKGSRWVTLDYSCQLYLLISKLEIQWISLKCKQFCFSLHMLDFIPKKLYLWGILLLYFIQKKSAAEANRILHETYGDHALLEITCRNWFRCFKSNNLDGEDKERSGAPKKVWRQRIGGITSWILLSGINWTCQIIMSWSHNSFEMFESIWNGSKARTLGAVWVEVKWCLVMCEQL